MTGENDQFTPDKLAEAAGDQVAKEVVDGVTAGASTGGGEFTPDKLAEAAGDQVAKEVVDGVTAKPEHQTPEYKVKLKPEFAPDALSEAAGDQVAKELLQKLMHEHGMPDGAEVKGKATLPLTLEDGSTTTIDIDVFELADKLLGKPRETMMVGGENGREVDITSLIGAPKEVIDALRQTLETGFPYLTTEQLEQITPAMVELTANAVDATRAPILKNIGMEKMFRYLVGTKRFIRSPTLPKSDIDAEPERMD
jgi:plastocyanin